MTWTRLDDGFTDRPIFEDLSYEARWHYLAMVSFCSRTSRYDGFIRAADARRCSDVPDPAAVLTELNSLGLVAPRDGGYLLPLIDEHVPPPHLRDETRKQSQRERKQRERQHKKGDHTYCSHPPEEDMSRVTSPVTSGRDGTGQDGTGEAVEEGGWPDVVPPGGSQDDEVDDDELTAALAEYRGVAR